MSKTTTAIIRDEPSEDCPHEYVVLCRADLPDVDYSALTQGTILYKSYFSNRTSMERIIRTKFLNEVFNHTPIIVKRIMPPRGY